MNSDDIFKKSNMYFGKATIGGMDCSVGYIKEFRWRWAFTQLNTFIFIANTDSAIDLQLLKQFSEQCLQYALKNNRGWPRGLHSGVASVAILCGKEVSEAAIEYCENLTKQHVAAFEIPVVYDLSKNKGYKFQKYPYWGTLYSTYLSDKIDSVLKQIPKI